MTEPLTAEQLIDGFNLLSVHVTDLEARVAGHRDADDQLAIKTTALKAIWDMLGVTDQTAACDRVIALQKECGVIAVKDAEIERLKAIEAKPDMIAETRRLNEFCDRERARAERAETELAAKDAEIERLQSALLDREEAASNYHQDWLREAARAERAEADLRVARTVDDGMVEWLASIIEAEPTERERIIEAETSQSHDQAGGDDESDAAFIEEIASHWKGVNGGIYTIHAMALDLAKQLNARRASQPRAATAAAERLPEIECTPGRFSGAPCLVGHRIPIAHLLAQIADGDEPRRYAEEMDQNEEQVRRALHGIADNFDWMYSCALPSAPEPAQEPVATWNYDMNAAPKNSGPVLIFAGTICIGWCWKDGEYTVFDDGRGIIVKATAWMPLPAPPSQEPQR